jgi:hypothetical protein
MTRGLYRIAYKGDIAIYYYLKAGHSTMEHLIKMGHVTRRPKEEVKYLYVLKRSIHKRLESFYKDKVMFNLRKDNLQLCQKEMLKFVSIQDMLNMRMSFDRFIIDVIGRGYKDPHIRSLFTVYPDIEFDKTIDLDENPEDLDELMGFKVSIANRTSNRALIWTAKMKAVVKETYSND